MGKIFKASIYVILICMILTSCTLPAHTTKKAQMNGKSSQVTSALPTVSLQPPESTVKPQEIEKSVVVSTRTVSKRVKNSFGILIKLDFKMPVLTGNYSGIERINDYYNAKEKDLISEKDSDYLNSDDEWKSEAGFYYFLSAEYHLETKLNDIISITGDKDSCTGGVTNPEIIGDVFNLTSGRKLGLDDIFNISKEEYLKIIFNCVSKKLVTEIAKQKADNGINDYSFDSPYSTEGKKTISEYDVNHFYLKKNALVVFYPKYAMATGAAGPQIFEIPFESILDVLAIDVNNVQVSALTLNKTNIQLNSTKSFKLIATAFPADASNPTVTWTTSDKEIAEVDDEGVVTGKVRGNVQITASSKFGNKIAVCNVRVVPSVIEGSFLQSASQDGYPTMEMLGLDGKVYSFSVWEIIEKYDGLKLKNGQKIKVTWQNSYKQIHEYNRVYYIDQLINIELMK